jgi:hypothetical protein
MSALPRLKLEASPSEGSLWVRGLVGWLVGWLWMGGWVEMLCGGWGVS